jgi:DNA-binding NarL/FixJ family response regulator
MTRSRVKKKASRKPAARIMIVDDHPAVREALAIRIGREPDLEVCGEAADLVEALHLADSAGPDVAVIDVALKDSSGIELIKRLRTRHENLRMIVWSMYGEDLYAERALGAGASGYITKEQATDKIIEAIRHVLEGKIYLSAAMSERLLRRYVGPVVRDPRGTVIDALSDRELEVFRFIGKGMKTAEIASRLHLSIKTVETYRDRIRAKLELVDGAKLVLRAMEWVQSNE